MRHITALLVFLLSLSGDAYSDMPSTKIEVNLDMKHSVDGFSSFDRKKYVTIHSEINGSDWDDPSSRSKMDYIFNDLDVYLGRNNGGIVWWATQLEEDGSRPGYALVNDIKTRGSNVREQYLADDRNEYDSRADIMIGGQHHVLWPGLKEGWQWAGADAVGEYMAHFVNEFFRPINSNDIALGEPAPRFLEILNEPLYALYDDGNLREEEKVEPIQIFEFHRDVARSFKKFNQTTLVGGYTTAFPEFDIDNFDRWDQRMKLFFDTAGAEMDFISLHFYDFHRHWVTGNTGHIYFKGSRMDATLDMVENYSQQQFGQVKPIIISEYGGRDHSTERNTWSAQRDWTFMKAFTPMLLSYMERPQTIAKTIPFIVTSFNWFGGEPPYPWRLLRKANEPENYTGEWVFTEMIKLYQLWSDVTGTRVDSWSTNPDIKVDAYVDGNKTYLILCNLSFEKQSVDLALFGQSQNEITNISVKHLHAVNKQPALDTTAFSELQNFTLDPEAAAVIEYTFADTITINHELIEKKYYGDRVKLPITAATPISTRIRNVKTQELQETILTLSFGRDKELSKSPMIKFNGARLNVPGNFSGDDIQEGREGFYGQLEIPLPADLVQIQNTVTIEFPDTGGFVSSVTLRTFQSSHSLNRPDVVTNISLYPKTVELGISQDRQLTTEIQPANARDIRINWSASDPEIVSVDQNGKITGKSTGTATISAVTAKGHFNNSCRVSVKTERVPVVADTIRVTPSSASIINGENIQLHYQIFPIDVDEKAVTWSSDNPAVATVDDQGNVTGLSDGTTTITATTSNGKTDSSEITSQTLIPGTASFENKNKYLTTLYKVGADLKINCNFTATTGKTVSEDGIKFWLRELKSDWSVVRNHIAFDTSAAGQKTGKAEATISLVDVTATADLPEGNFYYLWITFVEHETGEMIIGQSAFPINIVR